MRFLVTTAWNIPVSILSREDCSEATVWNVVHLNFFTDGFKLDGSVRSGVFSTELGLQISSGQVSGKVALLPQPTHLIGILESTKMLSLPRSATIPYIYNSLAF